MDWGHDFYASITFENVPNDRQLLVGWMNNWQYGDKIPTSPWRSTQSEPRDLSLRTIAGKTELIQQPAHGAEQAAHRARRTQVTRPRRHGHAQPLLGPGSRGQALDIVSDVRQRQRRPLRPEGVRRQRRGNRRSATTPTPRRSTSTARHSGDVSFHPQFASVSHAPLRLPQSGKLRLRILVDHSSVEVFADKGQRVITDQVFPSATSDGVQLFAEGGRATRPVAQHVADGIDLVARHRQITTVL